MRVAKPDRMDIAGKRKRVASVVGSSSDINLFPTAADRSAELALAETVAPHGRRRLVGGSERGVYERKRSRGLCRVEWWGPKHRFRAVGRHSACGSKSASQRDASPGEDGRGALAAPAKGV